MQELEAIFEAENAALNEAEAAAAEAAAEAAAATSMSSILDQLKIGADNDGFEGDGDGVIANGGWVTLEIILLRLFF